MIFTLSAHATTNIRRDGSPYGYFSINSFRTGLTLIRTSRVVGSAPPCSSGLSTCLGCAQTSTTRCRPAWRSPCSPDCSTTHSACSQSDIARYIPIRSDPYSSILSIVAQRLVAPRSLPVKLRPPSQTAFQAYSHD